MCVYVCVCVRARLCVCKRKREREREREINVQNGFNSTLYLEIQIMRGPAALQGIFSCMTLKTRIV